MKRQALGGILAAALFMLAIPAMANHVDDGGVDEAWSEPMNHDTYWEARFGAGWDCTKFENHSGYIPEEYEAAIVKDGNMVRVYASIGGAFTALGAVNPANGQHFAGPHSWVMKCNYTPTTTTSVGTTPQCENCETTTTLNEETTTTLSEETTTTLGDSTTTTQGTTTTSILSGIVWSASATCEGITVNWSDSDEFGISAVDFWMDDPQFGLIGPPDGLKRAETPGFSPVTVGSATDFVLVPVLVGGAVADPVEIRVTVPACTTTTDPSTTTSSTLPFTGVNTEKLIAMGIVVLCLGLLALVAATAFGQEEDI